MDVDYSPTGKEFVSGSFDKTIRVFPCDRGHSRYEYLFIKNCLTHDILAIYLRVITKQVIHTTVNNHA